MYIDSFKVFCDLVETSSFSKSAEKNKITQSAVSQQVRNLEIRFGVTLVERGRRQVTLTPEGNAFLEACTKILDIWDSFENRLGELKNEVAGEIKVAATFTIGLYELPTLVQAFSAKHPDVTVKVIYGTTDAVCTLVESGDADAGLIPFSSKARDLISENYGEDELVIVTAPQHPLANSGTAALSALEGQKMVTFANDSSTRKFIDKQLRDAGAKTVHCGAYDSVETIKRIVQVENCISIVPAKSIAKEVAAGTLAQVAIQGDALKRPLSYVVSRTRTRAPGLKEFLEQVKG